MMNLKFNVKSFVAGFAACAILGGSVAVYGQALTKNIEVAYGNIKVIVNGVEKTPSQEPFIYNGNTFVPLRFISEALDKKVTWDGDNKKIYIEDEPTKEAKQITLYDKQMADSAGSVTVDSKNKYIYFFVDPLNLQKNATSYQDTQGTHTNMYITYNLNGKATQLSGDFGFNQDFNSTDSTTAYCILRIYDESGKIIYESGKLKAGMQLSNFNVDVKGISKVKLGIDNIGSNSDITHPCIKNLTVTTTDY